MSGIVSLLFCGITLKHYAYHSMSRRTQRTTKYMFSILAQLSENFIFIYLGLNLYLLIAFSSTGGLKLTFCSRSPQVRPGGPGLQAALYPCHRSLSYSPLHLLCRIVPDALFCLSAPSWPPVMPRSSRSRRLSTGSSMPADSVMRSSRTRTRCEHALRLHSTLHH